MIGEPGGTRVGSWTSYLQNICLACFLIELWWLKFLCCSLSGFLNSSMFLKLVKVLYKEKIIGKNNNFQIIHLFPGIIYIPGIWPPKLHLLHSPTIPNKNLPPGQGLSNFSARKNHLKHFNKGNRHFRTILKQSHVVYLGKGSNIRILHEI